MLQRSPLLDEFEREHSRRTPPDYLRNLRIYEAMYEQAKAFGVLPPKDPLEGIEVKIRLAYALNHVRASTDETGTGAG